MDRQEREVIPLWPAVRHQARYLTSRWRLNDVDIDREVFAHSVGRSPVGPREITLLSRRPPGGTLLGRWDENTELADRTAGHGLADFAVRSPARSSTGVSAKAVEQSALGVRSRLCQVQLRDGAHLVADNG